MPTTLRSKSVGQGLNTKLNFNLHSNSTRFIENKDILSSSCCPSRITQLTTLGEKKVILEN